jgi:phosphomannomutase
MGREYRGGFYEQTLFRHRRDSRPGQQGANDSGSRHAGGHCGWKSVSPGGHRHRVVIGKDTRLSGYMIENALVAGFTSAGLDVFLLGPMPTPAVAMLTRSLRADIGVMISASHNPYQDNGIKLFGRTASSLSDELELEIEGLMERTFISSWPVPMRSAGPSVSMACMTATSNSPNGRCPRI